MQANEYREKLRKHVCEVTFTKKNGDERTMICTLHPEFMPDQEYTGDTDPDDPLITVLDIEANGWRSFNVDKISNFEYE